MKEEHTVTVYLSLEASAAVSKKQVCIADVASVTCSDPEVLQEVKKIPLFTFRDNEEEQTVTDSLSVIEKILQHVPSATVSSVGSPDLVIYYRNLSDSKKRTAKLKAVFVMLLAFFGTAYSIMSYNGDVGAVDLLSDLYQMFTGAQASSGNAGYRFGILAYCVGLFCGMMLFFNHGLYRKKADDPTPLQVQMRLYERDVNDTIIVDNARKGTDSHDH